MRDIADSRSARVLSRVLQRPVHSARGRSSTGKRVPLNVQIGDVVRRLESIWVGEGWPADLVVLEDMPVPWPRQLVVTGRRFSPGALERLGELGASWADETGRAYIEGPSGLLVVRDSPLDQPRTQKPSFRWSRSAEHVGEVILALPSDAINARQVAELTGWSHAQVSNVLRSFDAAGWTKKSGAARGRYSFRSLVEPGALLETWAAFAGGSARERILAHRVLREPVAFLHEELAPALSRSLDWACSGWAGLEIAAPFATAVPTLQIYVEAAGFIDGRLQELMAGLGLRKVEDGARVEFLAAERASLALARADRELPTVSYPRLYADLFALGGRGEDAAQHVREELLDF